jgi:hypothetical protein
MRSRRMERRLRPRTNSREEPEAVEMTAERRGRCVRREGCRGVYEAGEET